MESVPENFSLFSILKTRRIISSYHIVASPGSRGLLGCLGSCRVVSVGAWAHGRMSARACVRERERVIVTHVKLLDLLVLVCVKESE